MVIDAHYHPAFIKEVCGNEELAQRRRNDMAYYKTGVAEVKRIKERMRSSGVDRCFLLPHDYSTVSGDRRECFMGLPPWTPIRRMRGKNWNMRSGN